MSSRAATCFLRLELLTLLTLRVIVWSRAGQDQLRVRVHVQNLCAKVLSPLTATMADVSAGWFPTMPIGDQRWSSPCGLERESIVWPGAGGWGWWGNRLVLTVPSLRSLNAVLYAIYSMFHATLGPKSVPCRNTMTAMDNYHVCASYYRRQLFSARLTPPTHRGTPVHVINMLTEPHVQNHMHHWPLSSPSCLAKNSSKVICTWLRVHSTICLLLVSSSHSLWGESGCLAYRLAAQQASS